MPIDPSFRPPPGGVAVRMYRHGLGDSFLLAFDAPGRPRYVLIDCGVHKRQEHGPARVAEVLADLGAATGGRLDVVVATHEHADHLSGFVQPGSPFRESPPRTLTFTEFWAAWTEKVGDPQADRLRARRGAAAAAIGKAVETLKTVPKAQRQAARITGLNDFAVMPFDADDADEDDGPKGKGPRTRPSANEKAIRLLEGLVARENVRFCEPGMVVPIPGVTGGRAYVLGPPRVESLLDKSRPTGGKKNPAHEVYLTGASDLSAFQLAPALGLGGDLHDDYRHPFEGDLRIPLTTWQPTEPAPEPAAEPVGKTADEPAEKPTPKARTKPPKVHSYYAAENGWRRIDGDWLGVAEMLALDLEDDTNNTSLVLAFEWGPPGAGPVLLFVGDAQVGNWLSWQEREYRVGDRDRPVADLLGRTAVYKVGHHGSHNATLKQDGTGRPYGLPLMPGNMVALIPVDDAAVRREMPHPWDMPYGDLYRALVEKTAGRVLRSDGLPPADPGLRVAPAPGSVTVAGGYTAAWTEAAAAFTAGTPNRLYYDITLTPPAG